MSDGKRKRGLTDEQWAQARQAYEAGESESDLSRRYGADRKTIRSRKRKEYWIPHVTPHLGKGEVEAIRDRVRGKVIDIATRHGVDKAREILEQSASVEETARTIAEHLLRVERIGAKAGEALERYFDKLNGGKIRPGEKRDEAQVIKDSMDALKGYGLTLREHEGLRPGQPTIPSDKPDGKPTKIEFEIIDKETA